MCARECVRAYVFNGNGEEIRKIIGEHAISRID